MSDQRPHIVFVCTGNAARSVMGAAMLRARTDRFRISGAGTFVIEGLPMSVRTRKALANHELSEPAHRSRQLREEHFEDADLVVAFAPDHVEYVRRQHPEWAGKVGTLRRLVRDLAADGRPLSDRVAELGLGDVDIEPWEEVVDPAGGDQGVFDRCADEVAELISALDSRL